MRTLEITSGVPHGFWEDPYVLGFLNGCIGFFAQLSTQGRLDGEDLGRVLIDAVGTVSGRDGMEIGRRMITLQQSNDPDFLNGIANADKVVSVAYGLADYDGDPDVEEAKRRATAMEPALTSLMGPSSESASTGGMLQQMLFFDVVRERLGSPEI